MPQTQRKLRDSCDPCHIAKVKCIKTETSECLRCVSSSTTCSFSPSDRRGKPRGAKNKCNRVPPEGPRQIPKSHKSSLIPTTPSMLAPDEAYTSPSDDMDRCLAVIPPSAGLTADTWAVLPLDEFAQPMDIGPQKDIMASTFENEWPNLSSVLLTTEPQLIAHHQPASAPQSSIGSPYAETMFGSPSQFGLQQHSPKQYPELDQFEALQGGSLSPTPCTCYLVTLQSLYTLHNQARSTADGSVTPFDGALLVNISAIEHCHRMLTCSDCILGPDMNKSSTGMLMLAGTMDDILTSYGTTCAAYLDGSTPDPLILSSGDNLVGSSLSGSPEVDSVAGHNSRAHSISSHHSGSSTATSMSMHASTPPPQFNLGIYRFEGEDGRHLKLEILKIELRKMERLWAVFRDTCALQQCHDDQKSLYAALVCYLAKRLRSIGGMLEARRRSPGCPW